MRKTRRLGPGCPPAAPPSRCHLSVGPRRLPQGSCSAHQEPLILRRFPRPLHTALALRTWLRTHQHTHSEHRREGRAAWAPNSGAHLDFRRKPTSRRRARTKQAVSYFREGDIGAPDSKPRQAPGRLLSLKKCEVTRGALLFLRGQDTSRVPRPGAAGQHGCGRGRALSPPAERKAGGEPPSGEVTDQTVRPLASVTFLLLSLLSN